MGGKKEKGKRGGNKKKMAIPGQEWENRIANRISLWTKPGKTNVGQEGEGEKRLSLFPFFFHLVSLLIMRCHFCNRPFVSFCYIDKYFRVATNRLEKKFIYKYEQGNFACDFCYTHYIFDNVHRYKPPTYQLADHSTIPFR